MNTMPLISIIINNYNYDAFLKQCIDSALSQTYFNKEVIVVDDGSTDESRDVIKSYKENVIAVFQENQGQCSAFNAGFFKSKGSIIIFLDADDMLQQTALKKIWAFFDNKSIVKVHWKLKVIDELGNSTGELMPTGDNKLADGNLMELVKEIGPANFQWPPTSGNAWSRNFVDLIFPLDANIGKHGADTYLFESAPFFGEIKTINEPQSMYRVHANNFSKTKTFENILVRETQMYSYYSKFIQNLLKQQGEEINYQNWLEHSWWDKLRRAISLLKENIPIGSRFILVDDSTWGANKIENYDVVPILEENGQYSGSPTDDDEAFRDFERIKLTGLDYIIFTWPAFWWFDNYAEFTRYIESHYKCILKNSLIVAYEL